MLLNACDGVLARCAACTLTMTMSCPIRVTVSDNSSMNWCVFFCLFFCDWSLSRMIFSRSSIICLTNSVDGLIGWMALMSSMVVFSLSRNPLVRSMV